MGDLKQAYGVCLSQARVKAQEPDHTALGNGEIT